MKQKVTIYKTSEFMGNVCAIEGYLVEHGRKKYAQYDNAVSVKFIKKRCQNVSGFVVGYSPYILIVEGWNQVSPGEGFQEVKSSIPGIKVSKSKYMSFDSRYIEDFESIINKQIEAGKVKVVADYRDRTKVA